MSDITRTSERTIILRGMDDVSITHQDLLDLGNLLTANPDLRTIDVHVEQKVRFGSGTSWAEVLHLVLPSADFVKDSTYTALIAATIGWLKKRFRKPHEKSRPRILIILDPKDAVLDEIVITDEHSPLGRTPSSPKEGSAGTPEVEGDEKEESHGSA